MAVIRNLLLQIRFTMHFQRLPALKAIGVFSINSIGRQLRDFFEEYLSIQTTPYFFLIAVDCGPPPKPSGETVELFVDSTTVGFDAEYECRIAHYVIEGILGCIANAADDFISDAVQSPMQQSECNDHCREKWFTMFVWRNDKSCGCLDYTFEPYVVDCEEACDIVHPCGTTEPNSGAAFVVIYPDVIGYQEACLTDQETFEPDPEGDGDVSICRLMCVAYGWYPSSLPVIFDSNPMVLPLKDRNLWGFCAVEADMTATVEPSECRSCESDSTAKCGSTLTSYNHSKTSIQSSNIKTKTFFQFFILGS
ncbi:hypothetical protein LOTGIDRAFT_239175 [Lottia gigantea]|uniref:Uncharacterized protein n=1 Tax=Lottia gigantea TaxID=225164 RepID=V4C6C8_LOTGI|nr:hypothetical protein LOTGIDRAFT_239175 [Lottia gigantea]ESO97209.1 hypothetical protein LOTGIDRAFT_239175 [Lottia gigantea]